MHDNFRLTITGADDQIDPSILTQLSSEYPFVEWGILFSKTRAGTNRYPSQRWRRDFYQEIIEHDMRYYEEINTSAHLCGSLTEDILSSYDSIGNEIDLFYKRVQFNKIDTANIASILKYQNYYKNLPIILPGNLKTQTIINSISNPENINILFDSSGGRGEFTNDWPEYETKFGSCGYAGGINETNVETTLATLLTKFPDKPFWIDLETGARDSNDKFDLGKVESILEQVNNFYN